MIIFIIFFCICHDVDFKVTVVGDDVMVISGLLTPDLGVWWTPTSDCDIYVSMVSDTEEVDPHGSVTKLFLKLRE